jgi:hypothetical protein
MKIGARRPIFRRFAELWWVILPPLIPAVFMSILVASAALGDNPQGEFRNLETGEIELTLWFLVFVWWSFVYCLFCAPLATIWLGLKLLAKARARKAAADTAG